MSTYETAITRYITVGATRYAYRLFGLPTGIPLFLHIHFRGNMDHWDPAFLNPLALTRSILLIDSAGVGRSTGTIPPTYAGWAQCIVDVVTALSILTIDVFGHSMGGFVAQLLALNHPHLVRRVILAGTAPSAGSDVVGADLQWTRLLADAETEEAEKASLLRTFFATSKAKQAAGERWWGRMTGAREDRAPYLGREGTERQFAAAMRWFDAEFKAEGSYERLGELRAPVFVANGSDDIVVPTENSWVLYKRMVNVEAFLHLFADSGHGFLDEYHKQFSKMIIEFLDGKWDSK